MVPFLHEIIKIPKDNIKVTIVNYPTKLNIPN